MKFQLIESQDGFDKEKFDAVIQRIKNEMPHVEISDPDNSDTFKFTGTIREVHEISVYFIEAGLE